MDWGTGRYEETARQLVAAAEETVGLLAPQAGELVVDLGCGTGNASRLVAARGAHVLGVDPAARLLEVARAAVTAEGSEVRFELGDAEHLPVPDGSVDAVVSVFGVIFAPDVPAAAAEVARVLRPGGRFALSAWYPRGALADQMGRRALALAEVAALSPAAAEPAPVRFPWHDHDELRSVLGAEGFTVEVHERRLPFTSSSPEAYADDQLSNHPMWLEARDVLEPAGRWEAIRQEVVELFTEANEDPTAFRITSDYLIAVATL